MCHGCVCTNLQTQKRNSINRSSLHRSRKQRDRKAQVSAFDKFEYRPQRVTSVRAAGLPPEDSMSMVTARAETIGKPIAKTAKASLLGSLISTLQSEDYLSKRDRSLRLSTRHDGPFKKKKKKKAQSLVLLMVQRQTSCPRLCGKAVSSAIIKFNSPFCSKNIMLY